MKIAVTYQDGHVYPRFNETPAFKIYEVDRDHKIIREEIVPVQEYGYVPRAGILLTGEIDALVCGTLTKKACVMLKRMHKHIYIGAEGCADDAAAAVCVRQLAELQGDDFDLLPEDPVGCEGNCASCAAARES